MVILADENHGKIPEHSHIKGLVQHTLAGSAVAKEAKHHIIGTPVFFSKCQSAACTYLCTHNTMTSKKVLFYTKKVHTSTLSLAAAGCFSIELSHASLWRNT